MSAPLAVLLVGGLGEVSEGHDLAATIASALATSGIALRDGTSSSSRRSVSKADGRIRDLGRVAPSAEIEDLARITEKDSALVQAVLDESAAVLRAKRNVLIVHHRLGLVMANVGIDRSSVPSTPGDNRVLLLRTIPKRRPRRCARRYRCRFRNRPADRHRVHIAGGEIGFQDYFFRLKCAPVLRVLRFVGAGPRPPWRRRRARRH